MAEQPEFDFNNTSGEDGLTHWRQQRERSLHRLARRLGLPLGREVDVWLKDGVKLSGKLELKESMLLLETVDERNLRLAINQVGFLYGEMDSCVRKD